jgi:hypothetical protein
MTDKGQAQGVADNASVFRDHVEFFGHALNLPLDYVPMFRPRRAVRKSAGRAPMSRPRRAVRKFGRRVPMFRYVSSTVNEA